MLTERNQLVLRAIAESLVKAKRILTPKQVFTRAQKRLRPLLVQDNEVRGMLLCGASMRYFAFTDGWNVKITKTGKALLNSTQK